MILKDNELLDSPLKYQNMCLFILGLFYEVSLLTIHYSRMLFLSG